MIRRFGLRRLLEARSPSRRAAARKNEGSRNGAWESFSSPSRSHRYEKPLAISRRRIAPRRWFSGSRLECVLAVRSLVRSAATGRMGLSLLENDTSNSSAT